jgi:hypothetical protein
MNVKKLSKFIEDYSSDKITSQDFQEFYDLINLELSQLDIEAKLKYPNDYNQQMTYKFVRLEYDFKDFFSSMVIQKSSANNTNQLVCKLLNEK